MGQEAEIRADGSFNVSVTYQSGFWCPQTGSTPAVSPWNPAIHRRWTRGTSVCASGAVQQQCERN